MGNALPNRCDRSDTAAEHAVFFQRHENSRTVFEQIVRKLHPLDAVRTHGRTAFDTERAFCSHIVFDRKPCEADVFVFAFFPRIERAPLLRFVPLQKIARVVAPRHVIGAYPVADAEGSFVRKLFRADCRTVETARHNDKRTVPALRGVFTKIGTERKKLSEIGASHDGHNALIVYGAFRAIPVGSVRFQHMREITACDDGNFLSRLFCRTTNALAERIMRFVRLPRKTDAHELIIGIIFINKIQRHHRTVVERRPLFAFRARRDIRFIGFAADGFNKIGIVKKMKAHFRRTEIGKITEGFGTRRYMKIIAIERCMRRRDDDRFGLEARDFFCNLHIRGNRRRDFIFPALTYFMHDERRMRNRKRTDYRHSNSRLIIIFHAASAKTRHFSPQF